MTGTKAALRGDSMSIKDWVERKHRHVLPSLSVLLGSPLSPWSSHLAFYKLCKPVHTRLHPNDLNVMCLSSFERETESSSPRRPNLLWKCTFISLQCSRVLIERDSGQHVQNRHMMALIKDMTSFFSLHLFSRLYHTISYLEKWWVWFNSGCISRSAIQTTQTSLLCRGLWCYLSVIYSTGIIHIPKSKGRICTMGNIPQYEAEVFSAGLR